MQEGGGGDGEGRGKETFSCLPPYAAVPVKRLKGGGGWGGGFFHTCPQTQLLRRLKGNSLDSPLLPTVLSTFKKALYLSVNEFSTKALIGDTIFTSPTGDGTATEPREGLAICRAKPVPSLLSHFKTLSIGSVPGI